MRLISLASNDMGWFGLPVLAALWLAAQPAVAQECMVDEDCDSGECQRDQIDVGCDSDGECPEPEPTPGRCARDTSCDSDEDCPAGATCMMSESEVCQTSASRPIDGGAPEVEEPTCEVETRSECVYELIECSSDDDCSGPDVCTAIGEESDCSSGDPGAACAPGQECPQQPEPEEEECVSRKLDYCFPERVDCDTDSDCGEDERCVELIEDFQEEPPAGWEGATKVCFVEALALALEGEIEIEGPGGSSHDEASGADRGSSNSLGMSQGESKGSGADADTDDDDAAGGDDAVAESDDGCSVSAPGASGSQAAWALLGLALVALARRKTRG